MKTKTKQILSVIHVIAWIIFLGLCIKTGAIIYSTFVSLYINPVGAQNLHLGLDLSGLYNFDKGHYVSLVLFIVLLSALKALIFYLLIKIFLKINFIHPFSTEVSVLISRIGYIALSVGIITMVANEYCDWLANRGVTFPDLADYLGGAGEFLLLGGTVFMIAQVFKRGIEIQSEIELTV